MWKKLDNGAGTPMEFGSRQVPEPHPELVDEELEADPTSGPQRISAESQQPSKSATMAAYTEAVNEFTRNATAFIEQLPLLTKARDAYDRAMKANGELRKVLDNGEEDLRSLMTQLAQVLNDHVVKPGSEKKKPELAKFEATRATPEAVNDIKRFP